MDVGHADWSTHPLSGWIRRVYGTDSLTAWAEEAAHQLLQATDQLDVPVDLSSVLSARRVATVTFSRDLSSEARLETHSTGFSIRLRESLASEENEPQRRLSIAHEIGHTFFYDLDQKRPERILRLPLHDPLEEQACDSFAAALLVPRWYLRELAPRTRFKTSGPRLVNKICSDCRAPRAHVALRVRKHLSRLKSV